MTRALTIFVVLVSVCMLATFLPAYPKPSPFKLDSEWYLDFKHGTPQRIVVTPTGSTAPQAFWYMTYTVTNNTGEERMFLPVFEILDAAGQPIRAERNVPPSVFDTIKQREKNNLLEPAHKLTGPLLVGDDQAKDGVAIWAESAKMPDALTVFAAGLSSEAGLYLLQDGKYEVIDSAESLKTADNDKLLLLRKTLELRYRIIGDLKDAKLDPAGEEWIMR